MKKAKRRSRPSADQMISTSPPHAVIDEAYEAMMAWPWQPFRDRASAVSEARDFYERHHPEDADNPQAINTYLLARTNWLEYSGDARVQAHLVKGIQMLLGHSTWSPDSTDWDAVASALIERAGVGVAELESMTLQQFSRHLTHWLADQSPPPVEGAQPCELVLYKQEGIVVVDGQRYDLTAAQIEVLIDVALAYPGRAPKPGTKFFKERKPKNLIAKMPPEIRSLISSKGGHGGGYMLMTSMRPKILDRSES
ncbi:MAG: hypothetical protein ACE37H_03565 [Phycisphaeraceae bacterium]